jgi:hypothetical protein
VTGFILPPDASGERVMTGAWSSMGNVPQEQERPVERVSWWRKVFGG